MKNTESQWSGQGLRTKLRTRHRQERATLHNKHGILTQTDRETNALTDTRQADNTTQRKTSVTARNAPRHWGMTANTAQVSINAGWVN